VEQRIDPADESLAGRARRRWPRRLKLPVFHSPTLCQETQFQAVDCGDGTPRAREGRLWL
jgi:hypothetical protein